MKILVPQVIYCVAIELPAVLVLFTCSRATTIAPPTRADALLGAVLGSMLLGEILSIGALIVVRPSAWAVGSAKLAIVGLIAAWLASDCRRRAFGLKYRLRDDLWAVLVLSMSACALICLFALHFPVRWDSYSYHLPDALALGRTGLFSHFEYYGVSHGSYSPIGIRALWAQYLSSFGISGSSVVNLPAVVMVLTASYLVLAQGVKLPQYLAAIATLSFASIRLFLFYWFEAYLDLYLLGFVAATAVYAIAVCRGAGKREMTLLIISLGLLLGTKSQGAPLVALAISVVAVALLRTHIRGGRPLKVERPCFAWALLALVPSAAGYARNWVNAGNPLFPIRIDLPWVTLPGHFSASDFTHRTSIVHNFEKLPFWRIEAQILQELGPAMLAFLVIAMIAAIAAFVSRRTIGGTKSSGFVALVVLALTLIWGFVNLPLTGLDASRGLDVDHSFSFSLRYAGPLLGVVTVIALLALRAWMSDRTLGALLVAIMVGNLFESRSWLCSTVQHQYWHTIEFPRHMPNRTIAYAGSGYHFRLIDERLEREIVYVPTGRPWGAKWNEETCMSYHKTEGNVKTWLSNIVQAKADTLVLFNENVNEASACYVERKWVAMYPEFFEDQTRVKATDTPGGPNMSYHINDLAIARFLERR